MTRDEREQLHGISERLQALANRAPGVTRFRGGKTKASIQAELITVIIELRNLAGEPDTEPATIIE